MRQPHARTVREEERPRPRRIMDCLCAICELLKNRHKNYQAQLFLARLLAPLTGQPRFRLVVGLVGLKVSLAIGGAVSTGGEVAAGLSG